MPLTISGMSGVETDGMVQKLVEVESRPIKQLEIRKKNLNYRKESLKNLGKILEDVNSSARELYGLKASFYDKSAVSSDTSVLEAQANKNAEKGVKKIKVLQIATSHKISTDPMQEYDVIPAAKFTIEVNGEKATVNFKGGKLKSLKEKIDETASELVTTTYIRKSGDTYVLTIQSKKTGEKSEIKISGGQEMLKKIGLIDGLKSDKKSDVVIAFDKKYFEGYSGDKKVEAEDGALSVEQNGKAVTVRGYLWREYALPVEIVLKENMQLEFDVVHQDRPADEGDAIPRNLQIGPKERINIKGIILDGYNVNRKREETDREKRKIYESLMGIGVVAIKDGARLEKIYPLGKESRGKQSLPIGKDFKDGTLSKIILYCNQGTANFSNARLSTPIDQKGLLALKNVVSQPQDAKFVVDGIELSRDRNDGLSDVIKGITLTLKRPSQQEVDLRVEHSIETSYDKIKKFVDVYNKYLDYHKELTKAAKAEKPGDYLKTLPQSGFFVGDMTLMRLEGMLKTTVNSAYPSGAEKPIKIFPQMGVSTGAINADWETIKSGKLIIDETMLKKTITENPEGVAMFFGSDTDGDNKTDSGMAYKVVYMLRPYVSTGKNIIASKIELEDSSIKTADETIKRKEDHLKKYEQKLKHKFAKMDRALSESNSKKQWMKYQLEGMPHNNVDVKKEK